MSLPYHDYYFYVGNEYHSLESCSNYLNSINFHFSAIKKIKNSYFVKINSNELNFDQINKKITPAFLINTMNQKLKHVDDWESWELRTFFKRFQIKGFSNEELENIADVCCNKEINGRKFINLNRENIAYEFPFLKNPNNLEDLISRVNKLYDEVFSLSPRKFLPPVQPVIRPPSPEKNPTLDAVSLRKAIIQKYTFPEKTAEVETVLTDSNNFFTNTTPIPGPVFNLNYSQQTSYDSMVGSTLGTTIPNEEFFDWTNHLLPLNPEEQVPQTTLTNDATQDLAIGDFNQLLNLFDLDFGLNSNPEILIPLSTETESNKRSFGTQDNNPKRQRKLEDSDEF